uniref:FAD-dependent oxidoreductase n=1 Tax=Nocardioides sp. TaxID=35761 RepID=UPI00286E4C75
MKYDVVVVGAGIAGLTAARDLATTHDVLVLEGSAHIGGKLRLGSVAGVSVDVGAEAMLNRRPEGVALARELGLELVHPTTATSRIFSRGELRPMPRSLMGVPFDVAELASSGVLSAAGLARLHAETTTTFDDDVSVGE